MSAADDLRLGELRDGDRAGWEPLARGYKAFYETEVSDAGYDEAWQRLRRGAPMLGLGAWLPAPGGSGERLVGIAHAVFHASVWADHVCYLQDLFVDPALRGRGVAAALIEHLAQQARARGAARYYWLTQDSNARARRLYDRVAAHKGFIRYDHPLDPAR
jgi:ribosomal protein S18 acetylase RimI-like enzyme